MVSGAISRKPALHVQESSEKTIWFVTVALSKLTYSRTIPGIRSAGSDLSAMLLQDEDGIAVCFRLDCGPLLGSREKVLSRE